MSSAAPTYTVLDDVSETETTVISRAVRLSDGERVWIRAPASGVSTAKEIARLKLELRITEECKGPGVVAALGTLRFGDGLALVLEDFGGVPLRRLLPLDVRTAVWVAESVARILASIHERGVIHKQVTPDTIIVRTDTKTVKLTGFEHATRLSREPARLGVTAGLLPYLAPEQTGRVERAVDPRTDLYSLGIALYEMLAGAPPFASRDPAELIYATIARIPPLVRSVSPAVPEVVSSIVERLLRKAAEDRYQRASSLAFDLARCSEALERGAEIAPFSLGASDIGQIRLDERLYGRDREIDALLRSWQRAREGEVLSVLLHGPAGIGKSALAGPLREAVTADHGYFARARFEPKGTGHGIQIVRAFQGLVQQVLTESDAKVVRFRRDLVAAVGENAGLLTNLLPELSPLLGPKPSPLALAPIEAQNRFHLLIRSFVRVFATPEHPLALFLDDLQWIDPASEDLLKALLSDPERAHLLVVGALRRSPEEPVPAEICVGAGEAGTPAAVLSLAPLSRADVGQKVLAALGREPGAEGGTGPLADLIYQGTGGIPLALRRAFRILRDGSLVAIEPASGEITWSLGAVVEALGSGDVPQLAHTTIDKLSSSARRALSLGACIGRRFDLRTLAALLTKTQPATARDLWETLTFGLVLPLQSDYQLAVLSDDSDGISLDFRYEIVHESVEQAALELLSPAERTAVHRALADMLRARAGERSEPVDLFERLRHESLGLSLLVGEEERLGVARLALAGGQKARAETAYHAAAGYFEMGAGLVEHAACSPRDLAFELFLGYAECTALAGQPDKAEGLFQRAEALAVSFVEKAQIAAAQVLLYTHQGNVRAAVSVGLSALALFGATFPESEEDRQRAVTEALPLVMDRVREAGIDALAAAEDMQSPAPLAVQNLLLALQVPTLLLSPRLRTLVILEHVRLSLEHGASPISSYGYMALGAVLARSFRRYDEAIDLGQLAVALDDRVGTGELSCKLHHFFGSFLHFRRPLPDVLSHFEQAVSAGLSTGDFQYLGFAAAQGVSAELTLGSDLRTSLSEAERYLRIATRTGNPLSVQFLKVAGETMKHLTGSTLRRDLPGDGASMAPKWAEELRSPALSVVANFYHTQRLKLLYLQGDLVSARQEAIRAEERSASTEGMIFSIDQSLYTCLTLIARGAPISDPELFDKHRERIDAWAEVYPPSFLPRKLLLDAEMLRFSGDELPAMTAYDAAIDAARQSDLAQEEALANELSGNFHLSGKRKTIARTYLSQAYLGYLRWGASAKADDLAAEHPELVLSDAPRSSGRIRSDKHFALDVTTILRAAQAITQEIVLGEVLHKSMRIVLENAGAQRGFLFLPEEGSWVAHAALSTDPDAVHVGPMGAVDERSDVAVSIVKYVARSMEPVILDSAARGGLFDADPYLLARRPRSLLCLPLVSQGSVTGVLYLENDLTSGAFSPDRIELLHVLSSLSAIAVRNARLYERIQTMTDELRRTNEGLEEAVMRRTRELSAANDELGSALADRARRDAERAALEARLAQNERLASLGTLAAGVAHEVNNPLAYVIGNLDLARTEVSALAADDARAREVLTLLDGAYEGAERVRQIVSDLKGFSRTEEEPVQRVDVRKVVGVALSMSRNEVKHRAQIVVEEGEVPLVLASESRLTQVFLNLLVNAAQSIPDGAANRNRVTVRTYTGSSGAAVVEVEDTGCGIPEEARPRLFDPFFTTKPLGVGTGLGLSICHSIVTRFGGEIAVDSTPGQGSCFRVSLPPAAKVTQSMAPLATREEPRSSHRGRVLILDDEPFVAGVYKRILAKEHDVDVITSGAEALARIFSGETFDVILCDLMMPQMSGMEVYDHLRRHDPELAKRVIFLSGGAFGEKAEAFRAETSNLFLEKPCSAALLRRTVTTRVAALRAGPKSRRALTDQGRDPSGSS